MSQFADEKFKWGILGPGGIAQAFAKDLSFIQGHTIAAVGSRSLENAQKFSETFGGTAYGSYEELVADPTVDAIYVATPHPAHHAKNLLQ
jgi:predicted dehydrogenase